MSNVVLNTIAAEAFSDACDVLEKAEDFDLAVHDLHQGYMQRSIRGSSLMETDIPKNGWKEAERRGLPNHSVIW